MGRESNYASFSHVNFLQILFSFRVIKKKKHPFLLSSKMIKFCFQLAKARKLLNISV